MPKLNTPKGFIPKHICGFLTLLLLVTLVSYEGQGYLLASSTGQHPPSRGNTVGNTANGGRAVQYGDHVYYVMNDWRIKRTSIDGRYWIIVPHSARGSLNAYEGWLYFASLEGSICRVRLDDSGWYHDRQQLNTEKSTDVTVVDGWVYYVNIDQNHNIYRIRLDGSNQERVNNDYSCKPCVVDGWVYYKNLDDNSSIYRIRTDGTSREKLNNDISGAPHVIDGWVYYSTGGNLYKMRTDGSQKAMLVENVNKFNMVGNWIYFTGSANQGSGLSGGYIFRVDRDGRNLKVVTKEARGTWLNVAGQCIFFGGVSETYQFGRGEIGAVIQQCYVGIDGSGLSCPSPPPPIYKAGIQPPETVKGLTGTFSKIPTHWVFVAILLTIPLIFAVAGVCMGTFRALANFFKYL